MRSILTLFYISVFAVAALFFSANLSLADKPLLDADCNNLGAAIVAVDDFLDLAEIGFDSLGELLTASMQDDATFEFLQGLIAINTNPPVVFESPSQAITTIAQCGLMDLLVENIQD